VLRPDFVKLDRALIAGLHHHEAKAALVEMFGGFTSRIDAWLLAEGIEERDELSRLVQLGVALGQGYYLGRPDVAMRSLDPSLGLHMRKTAHSPAQRTIVAQLEERGVTARSDAPDEQLAKIFAQHPLLHALPLLDASDRPLALALRSGSSVRREAVLSVLDTTSPEDALQRALTRLEPNRFEPLACCDERGQYRGMLRIERLIEAALRAR
jgi:hypothetical protein